MRVDIENNTLILSVLSPTTRVAVYKHNLAKKYRILCE